MREPSKHIAKLLIFMVSHTDYWIPAYEHVKKSEVKAKRCHGVPSPMGRGAG
jgi:hypothetical protein